MKAIKNETVIEVLDEEFILHPNVTHSRCWRAEGVVSGHVLLNGDTYYFNQIVKVRLKKESDDV